MEPFFVKNYTGEAFQFLGAAHLTALSIVFFINLLLTRTRNLNQAYKRTVRITLAVILIINELAWHIWNVATGQWTIQTMLPLHLCSLLVWSGALMLLTRNYAIYEFSYFLGIAGAIQALMTPDLGIYGFPHFRFFQTFISHGLIVTSAIYMTVVEGYRPTWRSFIRVVIWMNLYVAIVFIINLLIGSNYLFIAHKPPTASLLDLLPSWPWYIFWMEAIGLLLALILYAPFAIRDWRMRTAAG